jgi:Rrf2 family protein
VKLSTKGRYGARAMLELACNYGRGPVLLREISERQDISARYLERMMTALVCAGLVRSSRGQKGGFTLAKPPKEISLDQIIQGLEGSIAPVACVDDPKLCKRVDTCITHDIWKKMKKAMLDVLKSITLEDMVEMQRKKLSK